MPTRTPVAIVGLAFAVLVLGPHPADASAVVSDGEMATSNEAREIAAGEGIRRFDSMHFNEATGHWEIEGRDATDSPIVLEIEASTGAVVRLLRRPPPVDTDGED